MKLSHFLLYLCSILSISCASEKTDDDTDDKTNVAAENLNGTWLVQSLETTYDNISGLKTGTGIRYSTIFITESEIEISTISCVNSLYPTIVPFTLIKNIDTLSFVNDLDEPFTIISNIELSRQYELTSSLERTTYEQIYTKLSSTFFYDTGHLQLNGAINAENASQVCRTQLVGVSVDDYSYNIYIPLDNNYVELGIRSTQLLSVGNYQYDSNSIDPAPAIYSFDVTSNADIFWSSISSNTLSPDFADIEITTSQANLIEGNFSFISQAGGNFTGTFSFVPY